MVARRYLSFLLKYTKTLAQLKLPRELWCDCYCHYNTNVVLITSSPGYPRYLARGRYRHHCGFEARDDALATYRNRRAGYSSSYSNDNHHVTEPHSTRFIRGLNLSSTADRYSDFSFRKLRSQYVFTKPTML